MTAPDPDAPLARLKPWIRDRLRPIGAYSALESPAHSDFDLNPERRVQSALLTPAAVLVALIERPGGPTVLLTRRSPHLRRHSGQIAFPGGRIEDGEDPAEAALRESFEEVGLEPQYIELLGLGDAYETTTGFCISPIVAALRPGFTLSADDGEVAEIFETPFAVLMNPAAVELRTLRLEDGGLRRFYAIDTEGRLIWGATAGVIRALSERLFGGS